MGVDLREGCNVYGAYGVGEVGCLVRRAIETIKLSVCLV